jgi:hypothetical protein
MRLAALMAALALAGCADYRPSSAKCFNLLEGEAPCDFTPVSAGGHMVIVSE